MQRDTQVSTSALEAASWPRGSDNAPFCGVVGLVSHLPLLHSSSSVIGRGYVTWLDEGDRDLDACCFAAIESTIIRDPSKADVFLKRS
jgi:hypothetical protein